MTRRDKILSLYVKYGALSSDGAKLLLERDYSIKCSYRTIQRDIAELVDEKKLVAVQSMKREQTYTLCEEEQSLLSPLFLSKVWDELFEIREELPNQEDQLKQSWASFQRLRSLVQLLPADMKDKVKPFIENFGKKLDEEDIERIHVEIGPYPILTVNGVPFGEEEFKRKVRGLEIIGEALERKVEEIIGVVSSMLHAAVKESRKTQATTSKNEAQST